MSTNSTSPVDVTGQGAAVGGTGAADAGTPEIIESSSSQPEPAPQDLRLKPKCLDPELKYEGVPNSNFYKAYPPDAWGEEVAPDARVWKIYHDKIPDVNKGKLDPWNNTLDVLLVFAGLFSAVSTAFIVESYKSLQPDYTQYVANFLYVSAKDGFASQGGVIKLPNVDSLGPPDSFIHPSATQRWTNGLWFMSLVISLTSALLCILIKQWLHEFNSHTTGSAPSLRHAARRHQLYLRGFETWHLPGLIALLPLFLHVALFLFFAGLVLFLNPLDSVIVNTLLGILALTLLFYVLALVMPAWRVECPSYTPMLGMAECVTLWGLKMMRYLSMLLARSVYFCIDRPSTAMWRVICTIRKLVSRFEKPVMRETNALDEQKFNLDGWALTTLLVLTNDADIIDAGVEAIGALHVEPTLEVIGLNVPTSVIHERICRDFATAGTSSSAFAVLTNARRMRTLWTIYCMQKRLLLGVSIARQRMMDLYPFLGLDGTMIQLIAASNHIHSPDESSLPQQNHFVSVLTSFHERLTAHLSELSSELVRCGIRGHQPEHSVPRLDRATCVLFLRMLSRRDVELMPVCVALTFCAGGFLWAEPHEQAQAVEIMHSMLPRRLRVARKVSEENVDAFDVIDCLFASLAAFEEGRGHNETTGLIARHLGILSASLGRTLPSYSNREAQLSGLAAFSQLPNVAQYVSQTELNAYIKLLDYVRVPSYQDEEAFGRYWACVATLLYLSCKEGVPVNVWRWDGDRLISKATTLLEDPRSVLALPETLLLKFLRISRMLSNNQAHTGCSLVVMGVAGILCHRDSEHLRPQHEELLECLFTGSFLEEKFRQLLPYARGNHWRLRILSLAKHVERLSPGSIQRLFKELEQPSSDGTTLQEEEVKFLGKIRRGLEPGGELTGDCGNYCAWAGHAAPSRLRTVSNPIAVGWVERILGSRSVAPEYHV